jgi:hypothetical protein
MPERHLEIHAQPRASAGLPAKDHRAEEPTAETHRALDHVEDRLEVRVETSHDAQDLAGGGLLCHEKAVERPDRGCLARQSATRCSIT